MKEKAENNVSEDNLWGRPSCWPLQQVEQRGEGLSLPSLHAQSVLAAGHFLCN
jgi:hypothetical protein